jgi:hypothetical protein
MDLNQRRPDVPFLVVESRGTSEALARLPVDLSVLRNLNRIAATPDSRDFYRVSRAVVVPRSGASRWDEYRGKPWPTASPYGGMIEIER